MRTTNIDSPKQPRFKLAKVDTAIPLSENCLSRLLYDKAGITLLVRAADGEKKRGGYFFCIMKKEDGQFALETMEQERVDAIFTLRELTRFINHAAGLKFDEQMLQYCQRHINFRSDEES